jgi:hypothetical protein
VLRRLMISPWIGFNMHRFKGPDDGLDQRRHRARRVELQERATAKGSGWPRSRPRHRASITATARRSVAGAETTASAFSYMRHHLRRLPLVVGRIGRTWACTGRSTW